MAVEFVETSPSSHLTKLGKKDCRSCFPRWKLKTDLVNVADGGEGDSLVEQQGGDADHAHTDPDDGEGHLGAPLRPEHWS